MGNACRMTPVAGRNLVAALDEQRHEELIQGELARLAQSETPAAAV